MSDPRGEDPVQDLALIARQLCMDRGMEAKEAEDFAARVADEFVHWWGGHQPYINKRRKIQQRDHQIYRLHCSGWDHEAIARKFDLTPRQVDAIIASVRENYLQSVQRTLFEAADG